MGSDPRPVSFGLLLAGQFAPGSDPVRGTLETLEQVREAREAGFTSVWASQHFLSEYQFLQPFPLLARVAADAGGMLVGAGVALAATYPPVLLAEEAASLDVLCEGRFVLGAGIGYRREEYDAMGADFATRTARLEATVPVLKALWAGDPAPPNERFFPAVAGSRLTLRPPQGGDLPVWIGASAPAAVERAARIGDEWLMPPELTLAALQERHQVYGGAVAPGRTRRHPLLRESFVAGTDEEAAKVALPALESKYAGYGRSGHAVATFDDMVAADVFVVGGPDRCVESLRAYASALDSDHVIVRMQWPGFDHRSTMASIGRYGEDIIPRFVSAEG